MTIALIDFGALYGLRYHANADNAAMAQTETLGYVRNKRHEFDVVAVCLDSPPYFRKERYPAYKAGREPWPAGAIELKRQTIELLRESGVHVLEAPTFEADDVVATAATWVWETLQVMPVVLSTDKDLGQLGDVATVCKLSGEPFDLGDLGAAMVPDYLALLGDKSDNLPGVRGVGKKLARQLLDAFLSLDGVRAATMADLQELPGVGEAKARSIHEAWDLPPGELDPHDVRELVLLRADAPIDCTTLLQPTPVNDEEESMTDNAQPLNDETPPAEDTQPSQREPEPIEGEVEPASGPAPRPQTRALATVTAEYGRQLEPTTPEAAWHIAQKMMRSGMFAVRNPESAFAIALAGREYGLGIVQSLMSLHIIEGRPSLSAGLIHALCLRSPHCEYFDPIESTNESCTFEAKRKGRPPFRLTWTMDDRRRVKSSERPGSNWDKYPRAMLRARCVSEVARTVFPDVVHNVYTPDEMGVDVELDAA